jgi:hypothetical protein
MRIFGGYEIRFCYCYLEGDHMGGGRVHVGTDHRANLPQSNDRII